MPSFLSYGVHGPCFLIPELPEGGGTLPAPFHPRTLTPTASLLIPPPIKNYEAMYAEEGPLHCLHTSFYSLFLFPCLSRQPPPLLYPSLPPSLTISSAGGDRFVGDFFVALSRTPPPAISTPLLPPFRRPLQWGSGAPVVLELKALGEADPSAFLGALLDPPTHDAVNAAIAILREVC